MTDLQSLLERVKGATGPDFVIEGNVMRAILPKPQWPYEWRRANFAPTARLDDALALVERMFPGMTLSALYRAVGRLLGDADNASTDKIARAVVCSLLSALIANQEGEKT